jgi:hypothetical protein
MKSSRAGPDTVLLHVGSGFLAGIRETGNAPGFALAVEQVFHPVRAQVIHMADMPEGGRGRAEFIVVAP